VVVKPSVGCPLRPSTLDLVFLGVDTGKQPDQPPVKSKSNVLGLIGQLDSFIEEGWFLESPNVPLHSERYCHLIR
jgi:hypothetical protein